MHFDQEDTHRHQGLRKELIDAIRAKGIRNEDVLSAMDAIPRHFFLDPAFDRMAYEDRAFPIGADQTISQPYTVAYMTELLEVSKYTKVLEIGTGSGYQAAVLASMGAMVYSIERQKALFDKNKNFPYLQKFKTLKMYYGDGYRGLPKVAPFDRIIITAAAPEVPPKLVEQLSTGGYMVLPVDDPNSEHQVMQRITKEENGDLRVEQFENFSFVPMLKGKNR